MEELYDLRKLFIETIAKRNTKIKNYFLNL